VAKPAIVAVDDDPQILSAVGRDLREHYGGNFRVVAAPGGPEGLAAAQQLRERGDDVALFLVDQRMPGLEGTDLLSRVGPLFPNAAKVLLTAYADTAAAIQAINDIGLDHYLMKPWEPPEQKLYPVLDDLLDSWARRVQPRFEGIRVMGTRYSPRSFEVKDFLARNQIPYGWEDVERDRGARTWLANSDHDEGDLPLVFVDDEVLVQPSIAELAAQLHQQTTASLPMYDLIIIGGGPAGLGAAVYGTSEGLSTALVERHSPGGQAGTSSRIENYLGFPKGITGADLTSRAVAQATRLGTELLCPTEATAIRTNGGYHYVTLADGAEMACRALLIASGMATRTLDKPGVERFTGRGLYYGAALTEAVTYRDEHVIVVGGANSAGQGAMLFSKYASKVSILIRGDSIAAKMSDYLIRQIEATDNIDILTNTEVLELRGDESLSEVDLYDNATATTTTTNAAAVFVFVGSAPRSELVRGVVELDDQGFVLCGPDLVVDGKPPRGWTLPRDPMLLETSVPGIFAAGDIQHGAVRRVASAVGTGAIAVTLVHQYLAET
jgi:thioredoxin reductase (NADPH)